MEFIGFDFITINGTVHKWEWWEECKRHTHTYIHPLFNTTE